jgi:hypothetical protein
MKNKIHALALKYIFLLCATTAFAQNKPAPIATPPALTLPKPTITVEVGYGVHLPAGVLAQRFGLDNYLAGGVHYVTPQQWIFGIDGGYFFGYDLKEDPLRKLRTPDGYLLGLDRENAFVTMDERGFMAGAMLGKVLPTTPKLPESGIRLSLTAGYMQHFIRIKDDNGTVPALGAEYLKGYDRLTGGAYITEFVGYQYVDNQGFMSLFAGFEFTQGFTKSLRTWQTDLMTADTRSRLDLLNGFRIAWRLPIRQKKSADIYY